MLFQPDGCRPGGIAADRGYGHWRCGAGTLTIDGKTWAAGLVEVDLRRYGGEDVQAR
jgi:hypothetical protein